MMQRKSKSRGPASDFMSLSAAANERIFQEIEKVDPRELIARSKPLNPSNRKWHQAFLSKAKGGRPKLGKDGVKVISLSVEKQLLERADRYAKSHGLKRAEFFSAAFRGALSKAV